MKNEHYFNLVNIFEKIEEKIDSILDVGSGKSSLFTLTDFFGCKVDAIIYPGDTRKKSSIEENIKNEYVLIEKDICKDIIQKKYDLVLSHLLLGEAIKWGNSFEILLGRIMLLIY